MDSIKKQQFGIKFPLTCDAVENYFLDTNMTIKEKMRSLVMHVIFTPKGQKLRDPNFGTRLIEYIFENNDATSWEGVKNDITQAIEQNIDGVFLRNIEVMQSEDSTPGIYVKIQYTINMGLSSINDDVIMAL